MAHSRLTIVSIFVAILSWQAYHNAYAGMPSQATFLEVVPFASEQMFPYPRSCCEDHFRYVTTECYEDETPQQVVANLRDGAGVVYLNAHGDSEGLIVCGIAYDTVAEANTACAAVATQYPGVALEAQPYNNKYFLRANYSNFGELLELGDGLVMIYACGASAGYTGQGSGVKYWMAFQGENTNAATSLYNVCNNLSGYDGVTMRTAVRAVAGQNYVTYGGTDGGLLLAPYADVAPAFGVDNRVPPYDDGNGLLTSSVHFSSALEPQSVWDFDSCEGTACCYGLSESWDNSKVRNTASISYPNMVCVSPAVELHLVSRQCVTSSDIRADLTTIGATAGEDRTYTLYPPTQPVERQSPGPQVADHGGACRPIARADQNGEGWAGASGLVNEPGTVAIDRGARTGEGVRRRSGVATPGNIGLGVTAPSGGLWFGGPTRDGAAPVEADGGAGAIPDISSEPDGLEGTDTEYLIIYAPSNFAAALGPYMAYCNLRGIYPILETIQASPDHPETVRQWIQESILEYATRTSSPVHYFLLCGDASDWQEAYGPLWQQYWNTPEWTQRHASYVASGVTGGQNARNIIPTWYLTDHAWACKLPYYYSDNTYADVNGDDLPDVVVARWPFANADQVAHYAARAIAYSTCGAANGEIASSILCYDSPLLIGQADLQTWASSAMMEAGLGGQTRRYLESLAYYEYVQGIVPWDPGTQLANHLHQYWPDVICIGANGSDRYQLGNMLWRSRVASYDAGNKPLLIGATCEVASFARTDCTVGGLVGAPMCEELLDGTSEWGAVAVIGPTEGSYQAGNALVSTLLMRELVAHRSRPVAESLRLVVRDIMEDNAGDDVGSRCIRATARAYCYLGDPLALLRHQTLGPPTGIREEFRNDMCAYPNPGNGSVRIVFRTATRAEVCLRIYDVRGRLVRQVYHDRRDPGVSEVSWDYRDESGGAVASGTYVARLVFGDVVMTRRLTLVR